MQQNLKKAIDVVSKPVSQLVKKVELTFSKHKKFQEF